MVNAKYCFLFPGQGAQYPKMGLDFYSDWKRGKEIFQVASEAACLDLFERLSNATEADLAQTGLQQVAITLVSVLSSEYLKELGVRPSAATGFSLGEFSAYNAAGVLSLEDTFRLVAERARTMNSACVGMAEKGTKTGMAAVMGLDEAKVREAISGIDKVWPANFTAPDQVVISGGEDSIGKAEEALKAAGAKRVIRLKVSGPFHTPLLEEANAAYGAIIGSAAFRDPSIDLFSAVSSKKVASGEEAKKLLLAQMISPVRWTDTERSLSSAGYAEFCETGPGKTLAGMWKSSGLPGKVSVAGKMEECRAVADSAGKEN